MSDCMKRHIIKNEEEMLKIAKSYHLFKNNYKKTDDEKWRLFSLCGLNIAVTSQTYCSHLALGLFKVVK